MYTKPKMLKQFLFCYKKKKKTPKPTSVLRYNTTVINTTQ